MKALFIVNAAPYGSESTYNNVRLAAALAKRQPNTVRLYLMGDAVAAAKSSQKVPQGHYNLPLTLQNLIGVTTANVGACGSCIDARGIQASELLEGVHRGTLEELADWSEWADKVFVF